MARFSFVELSQEVDPALRHRIVSASYASSHDARVILWLRGIAVQDVAPALDEAVRWLGTRFAGVEYLTDPDVSVAARHALRASVCVSSSDALRPVLDDGGMEAVTIEQALAAADVHGCFCGSCLAQAAERRDLADLAIA